MSKKSKAKSKGGKSAKGKSTKKKAKATKKAASLRTVALGLRNYLHLEHNEAGLLTLADDSKFQASEIELVEDGKLGTFIVATHIDNGQTIVAPFNHFVSFTKWSVDAVSENDIATPDATNEELLAN